MATGSGEIIGLMGALSIADRTRPAKSVQHDPILDQATQKLIRTAEETVAQARQAQSGIGSNNCSVSQDFAALSSLRQKTKQLADTAHAVNNALEDHFAAYIVSLGSQNRNQRLLLSHFEQEIKNK
jgi:hypothetical protein